MRDDEPQKQNTSHAWFVVDGSGEDEQFFPGEPPVYAKSTPVGNPPPATELSLSPADAMMGDGEGPQSPGPLPAELPQAAVLPAPEELAAGVPPIGYSVDKEADAPSGLSPMPPPLQVPALDDLQAPAGIAEAEPLPDPGTYVVCADPVVDQVAVVQRAEPDTEPTSSSRAPDVPVLADLRESPSTPPASGFGFRQADVIRVGGVVVSVPVAHVGVIVTTRTPQRVRLGQVTVLKEARTVIGRGRVGCFVDDPAIAALHAVITYQCAANSSGFYLHTSVSAPTLLNHETPESMVRLRNGDLIALGHTDLVFLEVPLERGGRL